MRSKKLDFGGLWEGLPYIRAEFNPETSVVETKTLELNMISNEPAFGKLDWIVGLFYFDHEIENYIYEFKDVNNVFDNVYISELRSAIAAGEGSGVLYDGIDTDNQGYFGLGRTWNVGLRYTF